MIDSYTIRQLEKNRIDEKSGWERVHTNKGRVFFIRESQPDEWLPLSQEPTPEPTPEKPPGRPSSPLSSDREAIIKATLSPESSSEEEDSDAGIEVCDGCREEICYVHQFMDEYWAYIDYLKSSGFDNKQSRFKMYRHFYFLIHGSGAKGDRIALPECVVNCVKGQFPAEDGQYVGFIDGKTTSTPVTTPKKSVTSPKKVAAKKTPDSGSSTETEFEFV